jgi:hypothetical protein
VRKPTSVCLALGSATFAAASPCSQWLVALTGCRAPLPSPFAKIANAAAETRVATVPVTTVERPIWA